MKHLQIFVCLSINIWVVSCDLGNTTICVLFPRLAHHGMRPGAMLALARTECSPTGSACSPEMILSVMDSDSDFDI